MQMIRHTLCKPCVCVLDIKKEKQIRSGFHRLTTKRLIFSAYSIIQKKEKIPVQFLHGIIHRDAIVQSGFVIMLCLCIQNVFRLRSSVCIWCPCPHIHKERLMGDLARYGKSSGLIYIYTNFFVVVVHIAVYHVHFINQTSYKLRWKKNEISDLLDGKWMEMYLIHRGW